jgi:hypothetical protein
MGKVATSSTSVRTGSLPAGGPEPGGEGISLFGISLSRIMKIPLRHWLLTLLLLGVCTGAGYLYGKFNAKSIYKLTGTLLHRPPPEPRESIEIPPPKTWEALTEEFKTLHYYEELNKQMGMAIPAETFVKFFDVKKGPEGSNQIIVGLDWEDSKQGADLINALIGIHRREVERYRKADLENARQTTVTRLDDCRKELEETRKEIRDLLLERNLSSPDEPQKKVDSLRRSIDDVDKEARKARSEYLANGRSITKLKAEIDKTLAEIDRLKRGNAPKTDDEPDPEFERKDTELKQKLQELRLSQKKNQRELSEAEYEHDQNKELYEKGIITGPKWKQILSRLGNARDAVKADELRIADVEAERRKLRPGVARMQALLTEQKIELRRQEKAQAKEETELQRLEKDVERLREEERKAAAVQRGWDTLYKRPADKAKSLEAEEDRLFKKKLILEERLAGAAEELRVSQPATPSILPISDARKKFMIGFLVPLLLGLGLMVGREMLTTAWRAETLADRLGLPILARVSPEAAADVGRGLSLRIRQSVPDEGGVVLLGSLNDGPAIDQLVGRVSRYLGMRNERALILDARIAHAQADGLVALIDRRADGKPLEVAPPDSLNAKQEPGLVGLIQYLVFEGQDFGEFTYRTRLPNVDYLPAGGPYALTDALASEPMEELIAALRQRYTIILLVGPAVSLVVDTEILAAYADGVILVVNQPLSSYTPAVEDLFRSLREKDVPLVGAVLCV